MTQHDDAVALRHMPDDAHTARRLAEGRSRDDLDSAEMLQLAPTRAVEVIGEAARRVTEARRTMDPHIPWREITGPRPRQYPAALGWSWAAVEHRAGCDGPWRII